MVGVWVLVDSTHCRYGNYHEHDTTVAKSYNGHSLSLIPRPSPLPGFDCLHYTNTEGEGLVNLTMWSVSLVPKPPPFYLCVHDAQEWKTGEKRGRPGNIHHVSGCEVDVEGRGRYPNIYGQNLKASFLPLKTSSIHHIKVWSPKTW